MNKQKLRRFIRRAKLNNEKVLDLSNKYIDSIPPEIGDLSELKILYLFGNQLKTIPPEINKLTKLEVLDLSKNCMIELPGEIGKLSNLQTLNLRKNSLISLTREIENLSQLKVLHLTDNQFTELPKVIGKLIQLTELSIDGNKFSLWPSEIEELAQLDILRLNSNKLTSIPSRISKLKQLKGLRLDNNQLTMLPEEIGQLIQLEGLRLDRNMLNALPPKIGKLAKLKELWLNNNQLKSLPKEILYLTKLEQIFLHGNPELNIPPEILGPSWDNVIERKLKPASPKSILDYYFRIHPPKHIIRVTGKISTSSVIIKGKAIISRPLNEAKLILVGPGEAGKTSIVNRLVKNRFNQNESTTHGIRITPWKVKVEKDDIRLNTWDFGGQEIMHATHQFFLTHRSLYLIVLDGRKGREDEDAEYWLKFIKTFGGGSPTIIVMNKQKLHSYDLNRRALEEKYPFIRRFIPTDCKPERKNGIPELKQEILEALGDMPEVRTPFPGNWFEIKDNLAKMKNPLISFKDYRNLCAKLNEKDEKAQENLAYYLSCLGIALNFRNDPRLNETSVLKPQWITRGVYRIITSPKLKNTKGELRYSDLPGILPKKDYPEDKYNFLLDLMRKFELCFEFHDAGEGRRFLVPELLDIQKPNLGDKFAPEKCLNFRYEYKILPEGLLPRFIVRTYPMSEKLSRWRSGVVLEWEGCKALIEADKAERQVIIRVNGTKECRRRLLSVIRSNFDHIHHELGEFKPIEWIAPEDHPLEWVSYNDLEVHARKGKKEYSKSIGNELVTMDPAKMIDESDVKSLILREEFDQFGVLIRNEPIKAFIVYSHKDDYWRDKLQSNLDILVWKRIINVWYDQRLVPGDDWDETIMEKLDESEIIILLVSTPMLASKYIQEKELPKALELHKSGKARVIPVIISACSWDKTPLKNLQALPTGNRNIKKHPDKDKALLEVEEGIRKAAKKTMNSEQ